MFLFYELLFEEAAHFNVLLEVCAVFGDLLLDLGDWRKVEFVIGHDVGVYDVAKVFVAAVVAAIVAAHFGAMSLLCFSLRVYC